MNREEAKQLLPIIQAFAEGKTVQCRAGVIESWDDLGNAVNFLYGPDHYRIKPEPKLRPWTKSECPKFILARYAKDDGFGRQMVRAWQLNPDGEYECSTPIACPRETATPSWSVTGLIRIAEDGTERPCGVMEAE